MNEFPAIGPSLFYKIFGNPENMHITIGFLSDILELDVVKAKLLTPEFHENSPELKQVALNEPLNMLLAATLKNAEKINVQISYRTRYQPLEAIILAAFDLSLKYKAVADHEPRSLYVINILTFPLFENDDVYFCRAMAHANTGEQTNFLIKDNILNMAFMELSKHP